MMGPLLESHQVAATPTRGNGASPPAFQTIGPLDLWGACLTAPWFGGCDRPPSLVTTFGVSTLVLKRYESINVTLFAPIGLQKESGGLAALLTATGADGQRISAALFPIICHDSPPMCLWRFENPV